MKLKITKNYQETKVFDNIEIDLKDKCINVILGPSGCGKTTLLQCIAHLTAYEGTIETNHKKIGYVFQEDRLFPHLTVYKNLEIIEPDKKKINDYLNTFKVDEIKNHYPSQISGGEKQRISIIRAFLGNHDVILMDEPFKSLDFDLKNQLIELVKEMQKTNQNTVILVTHDLDIALYLGHVIHVLSEKVSRLIKSFDNPYVNQELNEQSVKLRNELKNGMKTS